MIEFNFLADEPPKAIDALVRFRVPKELQMPAAALVAACVVVVAWWGLERHWVQRAATEEQVARVRLQHSQTAFAATKIVRTDIERLLALDRRIRQIRLSGVNTARALSDIGNRLPPGAWLTSLSFTTDGSLLEGRARALNVVGATMTALIGRRTSPRLVRAVKDDRVGDSIAFSMQLEEKSP